ncbi:MAG: alanine dehydrogenase [Alicyclobacillus macrosporangiidus]|uniref:alanine dehydrogenase n=1 Tax=Alicyclobacillus macrosporangiidus TaxID=392015 RepID=UPI0026EBEB94|nr:alanine dehydrogenase [Alicyclobacillus macrosporangiidus]MCL6600739.1 alanine dehydrogenase [Alicyclobacillus macrosporangiidus]
MIIGVPKERKQNENRVAITPAGVRTLVMAGHTVYVENGAGVGCGFSDAEYEAEGAFVTTSDEVWTTAQMVMKVKEPLPEEYPFFREDLILFTYLHLAADPPLVQAMLESGITGIGYETVQTASGSLPLLAPMSQIAGRMAPQIAAQFMENHYGGRGVLLGGVPGVKPAHVVIVGGGNVGTNAARIACGMGARVTVLDTSPDRLRDIDNFFDGRVATLQSNPYSLEEAVRDADVLIGAVLLPGARAPKIISEDMVRGMRKGSVIVDVAIDQGGCVATIDHITTHDDPVYEKYGVLHYAVANIPGAVARTATLALTNSTLSYALEIANLGLKRALEHNLALQRGLNTFQGKVTCQAVAESLGFEVADVRELVVTV